MTYLRKYLEIKGNASISEKCTFKTSYSDYDASNLKISKLSDRLDTLDSKVATLTHVINLLQKYTEISDHQREKIAQKSEYDQIQQTNQFEYVINRINELDLSVKAIAQRIQHFEDRDVKQDRIVNPQKDDYFKNQKECSETTEKIRNEFNKKIESCFSTFQLVVKEIKASQESNQNSLQHIFFNLNKMENEQAKLKLTMERQIEEMKSKFIVSGLAVERKEKCKSETKKCDKKSRKKSKGKPKRQLDDITNLLNISNLALKKKNY